MKNRKWISLAVSALLSVTALPTMAFAEEAATETVKEATAKSAKELTEITLNEVAHSIFYAPQYVAIEEGYFAEEGIALTLVTGFGADKVMTALLSGEAEIGFMGSEASIYTYSGGAGDAPVNFAQLTQRAGNFLVAREEMPDFTWADLIGKDVLGGRKGGMPQMVFEYILRQNDIDPSEVQIDQSIEPGATTLEQEGVGTVVASLGTDSGYVPYTAYCTKSGYLSEHPKIIQAFTNALQRGMEYVHSHTPEEIAAVIAPQFPESDLETITMIVARYAAQDTWKENLIFEQESFELLQDILTDAGELESRVPYDALVTTAFAKEAAAIR